MSTLKSARAQVVAQQALKGVKVGDAATALVDTYPGVRFGGVIEAINSKVDNASRYVQVRASFHNADRRLVPGMFATVAVDAGEATSRITLPQTTLTYNRVLLDFRCNSPSRPPSRRCV